VDKLNLAYIVRRRNELGLTLQEMAEALGFKHASTYHKYETGQYSFRANHLPMIARKLLCTLDALYADTDLRKQKNIKPEAPCSAQEANKRQLEIWKKTLLYEIEMMAPRSSHACDGFLQRLHQFEKEIGEREANDPAHLDLMR